jgi:hypothetical protein
LVPRLGGSEQIVAHGKRVPHIYQPRSDQHRYPDAGGIERESSRRYECRVALAGWLVQPHRLAQSKDIRPAVEIDERRPPVDPGRLRCERVLDFLTCADWAPSNMVGANADGDRGLVYACQQSQRTAQAELVADLEGDRTAVQVRPVDGFAAPLARRGLRHDAAA